MSESKMREEFEAWVISNWPNQSLGRFNPLHGVTEGEYTGFTVQHCWEAWQASREALVIALPQQSGANLDWNQAIRYCHQAIESHGLKVSQ